MLHIIEASTLRIQCRQHSFLDRSSPAPAARKYALPRRLLLHRVDPDAILNHRLVQRKGGISLPEGRHLHRLVRLAVHLLSMAGFLCCHLP